MPCFNEAATIGGVVADLRKSLPEATVYVYDNNSNDYTSRVVAVRQAPSSGSLPYRGRGTWSGGCSPTLTPTSTCCIDGDGTYDASKARQLVDLVDQSGFDS